MIAASLETRSTKASSLDSLYIPISQAAFLGNDANDDAMVRSVFSAVVFPFSV